MSRHDSNERSFEDLSNHHHHHHHFLSFFQSKLVRKGFKNPPFFMMPRLSTIFLLRHSPKKSATTWFSTRLWPLNTSSLISRRIQSTRLVMSVGHWHNYTIIWADHDTRWRWHGLKMKQARESINDVERMNDRVDGSWAVSNTTAIASTRWLDEFCDRWMGREWLKE